MKKLLLLCLCIAMLAGLSGCKEKETVNELIPPVQNGVIGDFSLSSPAAGERVYEAPVFSWTAAEGADSYTLEVCSSNNFSQSEDKVYIKKSGIVGTSFSIGANLSAKNADYYWRVTAENAGHKRSAAGEGRFYLSARETSSVPVEIGYADEWAVHEIGSAATVSVDKSNFFGNGQNALKVAFCEEDTNRGIPASDGWMVITRTAEYELYGVDAFFFNFYYSGDDAEVYLRVVDDDNEYWHARIRLATNARQQVIIGFDEFELRTRGGTTIANRQFDYQHIKAVELVFEKAFGDGVALLSDLRAVRRSDYDDFFISKMDFRSIDRGDYVMENYRFETSVSEDGRAFTYSYGKKEDGTGENINGYGFVKLPVGKLLTRGDALAVRLRHTGTSGNADFLLRIIEEDGDRWVYEHRISAVADGELIFIPFSAFTLSEYHGDGARQFYYVRQIQFGLRNNYQAGSITVADLEVVTLSDKVENLHVGHLSDDGTIDDFEGYRSSVETYYVWQSSSDNKDEQMTLDREFSFGAGNTCLRLGYKSDMFPAVYGVRFDGRAGYNAVRLWMRDRSVKSSEALFAYLGETVSARMTVTLYLTSGDLYHTTVDALSRTWTEYVFAFGDFLSDEDTFGTPAPLVSEEIAGISVSLQYFYYDKDGASAPVYMNNNIVYLDNLALTTAGSSSHTELAHRITPSADDPKVAVADDFDGALLWNTYSAHGYEGLETVSSYNGTHCLRMQYKGYDSVSYGTALLLDTTVDARAIRLRIKGDGVATIYINLYLEQAGKIFKFRAEIPQVTAEWTEYTIGFDNFVMVEGEGSVTLSGSNVRFINKITFGIVNRSGGGVSSVLVDDIVFDGNAGYTANTAVAVSTEE